MATFSSVAHKGYSYTTSLPTLSIFLFFNSSNPNVYEVVSHCSLELLAILSQLLTLPHLGQVINFSGNGNTGAAALATPFSVGVGYP